MASAPTSTGMTGPTSSPAASGGGGPTSSPLLFFVALGFGVVFTNLWIIVGVKYCFRYNQRNRQRQIADENGEPIDLTALPRAHRRRREKKLMTMEEVNERFPLTKYKSWMATRAEEGLPTAGGVAAPTSRPGSVKDTDGTVAPYVDIREAGDPATPLTATTSSAEESKEKSRTSHEAHEVVVSQVEKSKTTSTIPEHRTSEEAREAEEIDDDDQIQMAVPTEMLATPGDSCAICLDTLEDDDDVRGLTCGHAFHASCLDPWLTSRRACCPLCKADYYVPKPRAEGDAGEESSRAAREGHMPFAPAHALVGGRGATSFGRTRMVLPGRFMTISYNPQGTDRFPTVQRIPRPTTQNQNSSEGSHRDTWRSRLGRVSFPSLPGRARRNNNPLNPTRMQPPENRSTSSNPTPGQLEAGAH